MNLRTVAVATLLSTPAIVFAEEAAKSTATLGMTVSGQVTNKEGGPQPGIGINWRCTRSASDETEIGGGLSAPTGPDGRFTILNVPAGECMFLAEIPAGDNGYSNPCKFDSEACGGPTRAHLTIVSGVNVHDLQLEAPVRVPDPGVVVGKVVDEAGNGIAGTGIGGTAVIARCGFGDCAVPGVACGTHRSNVEPDGTFTSEEGVGLTCRLWACVLDAADLCREGSLLTDPGPCPAGESCAFVTVTVPPVPVRVTLRRGAAQP